MLTGTPCCCQARIAAQHRRAGARSAADRTHGRRLDPWHFDIGAVRTKSELLTQYTVAVADAWRAPLGVRVTSPRDPARRGSHVTLCHPDARALNVRLIDAGVIPDFPAPDALRLGLSPLSTSFAEVHRRLSVLRGLLTGAALLPGRR